MPGRWALLPLTTALLLTACDACDSEGRKVPFKRTEGPSGQGTDGERSGDDRDGRVPFEPTEGRTLPEGTTRVAVEGAPVQAPKGALRALLPQDVDDDGDRDGLFVRTGDQGAAWVLFARRDAADFAPPEDLARIARGGPGCTVEKAGLRTVSRRLALASLRRSCDQGPDRTVALIALERQPRVRERITLLPPEGRTPGAVSLGLRTEDRDEDGYEDVVLNVSVRTPELKEATEVELPWLDRPGGLARDRDEPEKSITELADEGVQALGEDASKALTRARQALAVHAVLCREGGTPRIRFGEGDGLECGSSRGAAKAASVATAALVQEDSLFEALRVAGRLQEEGFDVTEADRARVTKAWNEAPTPEGLQWRKVTTHRIGRAPDVHLPAVALPESDVLLLRGSPARRIALEDQDAGVPSSKTEHGSLLITDPSGKHAVVDVHRSCRGYELTLVRSSDIAAGVVAGRAVSKPLLEPRAPPAGAPCPGRVPKAMREQNGDWRVLGWAPQGIVAAQGDIVRVVPLTVQAKPAGEPTVLAEGTPMPAPLPPGAATPDGEAYVLGTPYGVLLHRVAPQRSTSLLRPDGWQDAEGEVASVAVAPDLSRVALMRGRQVWLMEGYEL